MDSCGEADTEGGIMSDIGKALEGIIQRISQLEDYL